MVQPSMKLALKGQTDGDLVRCTAILSQTGAGHELANLCSLGAYEKAQSLRAKSSLYCAGVNRKGKKCQAMAMPGSQFCHAHAPAELHAASFVQDVAKAGSKV